MEAQDVSFLRSCWFQIVIYNEGEVVSGAPCDLEVGIGPTSVTLAAPLRSCAVGVEQLLTVSNSLSQGGFC